MIGETLAHYTITAKLGEGGMGAVYRAEDTQLGRAVAIKVLPSELSSDPDRLERFEREARTVAALNHPNIVTIYSVEHERGLRFLTMEVVDGETLRERIPQGGLPIEELLEIALPLADALATAHEKGITHRDLKPGNLMFTGSGRLKVLDFGLAKHHGIDASPESTQAPTELLTQAGQIVGTLPYMAPEQLEGKAVDSRADLFSFGILLYEMATGRRPFEGEGPASVISAVVRDSPTPLLEARADLPESLGEIVHRCLEKAPTNRYQDARQVLTDLETVEREVSTAAGAEAAAFEATAAVEPPPGSFRVGEWTVRPDLGRIYAGDRKVRLEPKLMALLVFLAERPGQVLSKEEIVDGIWEGAFISDSALTRAVSELRRSLEDDAQRPRFIETIPKKGYRLVARVEEVAVEIGGPTPRRSWLVAQATVALGLLLALIAVWITRDKADRETEPGPVATAPAPVEAEPPRIAVLPFESLGEAEDEYFVPGVTEELTSRLVLLSGLGVISRNSSDRYAGSQTPTRQIGEELGAQYLLEGVVRWIRTEDGRSRIRVAPRLIRVEDDTHVWTQVYDRVLDDILGIQTEIARDVAVELGVALLEREEETLSVLPTDNLEAYRAYQESQHYLRELGDDNPEEKDALVVAALERAVELDPGFVDAWLELGGHHAYGYYIGLDHSPERRAAAVRALDRVRELAPDSLAAYRAEMRYYYAIEPDMEKAREALFRIERLAPSDAGVQTILGRILRRAGRLEEAEVRLRRAAILDPLASGVKIRLGETLVLLRRYPEARREFEASQVLRPQSFRALRGRLESLWLEGDTAAARAALEEYPQRGSPPPIDAWLFQELYEGRHAEALERLRRSDQEWIGTPVYFWPRELWEKFLLELAGRGEEMPGGYEAAIDRLEAALEEQPDHSRLIGALGVAYALAGRREEAVDSGLEAVALMPLAKEPELGTWRVEGLAWIYTILDEPDLALDQLEILLDRPSTVSVPWLEIDPRWAPLRDHPRFRDLRAKHSAVSR